MPNIKSAIKRVKVAKTKTAQNQMVKSALKTAIKKFEAASAAGDKENLTESYTFAVKKIDQACAKGILKKNTASRKKSKITKKYNAANA